MMAEKVVALNAWKGKLEVGPRGPKKTLRNLMLHLQNVPGLGQSVRYNEFTGRVEWRGRPLADEDVIDVRMMIEDAGYEPKDSDVWPALIRHAHDNAYDPVREYLDGLAWDNVPRLDAWLHTYLGAPEHEILSVFGAKFLIGAVARVYEPGCQMDNMLVLEGKQGAGKTTAVSALFGREYMISSISDFKSKEASIALQGRWVAEVAELAALKKTDITDVKKFITETVDQFRPVHGRNTVDRPRRCVFVGTTNEHQYLKDATGNRRFWPVPCGTVNVLKIAQDRDQLWAEAVHRYRLREPWWLTDDVHLAKAESIQGDRTESDVWGELIDLWLAEPKNRSTEFMTIGMILSQAIKMPADRQNRADEMRVANHLTKRNWTRTKRRLFNGGPAVWCWKRPEA